MAKFKVVATELITYVYYVQADNEDQAIDKVFDERLEGEEIANDCQIEKVEEV